MKMLRSSIQANRNENSADSLNTDEIQIVQIGHVQAVLCHNIITIPSNVFMNANDAQAYEMFNRFWNCGGLRQTFDGYPFGRDIKLN